MLARGFFTFSPGLTSGLASSIGFLFSFSEKRTFFETSVESSSSSSSVLAILGADSMSDS